MKKTLRLLVSLSILASSMLIAQPASAIGSLYSPITRSGDVRCSVYGFFTVIEGVVTRSEDCYGSAVIPSGVTVIDNDGFSYSSMDSVTIPNTVLRIGDRAFERARYLSSVIIPNSVIDLGRDAFRDAESLVSAVLGSGITTILPNTFRNARALTSITIPNSVTEIGSHAFAETYVLTSITIPNSVTRIGDYAFTYPYSGYGLTSITIPNSVTELGEGAFRGASMLTSVTLGNGITAIRAYTFYGASSLTSITIPDNVTELSSNAFLYTNLTDYRYCGSALSVDVLSNALGDRTNTCTPTTATVSVGAALNSQVATFATGVTEALIPATAALPAVKLTFTTTAPPEVTVVPMSANPAPLTATPFKVTGSPKIVDIQITSGSHDGSVATVCLDGTPTDSVWHYTGGQWVELGNRSYDAQTGQVCGETNSFSPFTAAPASTNPNAPGTVVATATGKRSATVSFTAPTDDGGATITSYTVVSTPGSITKTLTQSVSGVFNVTGLQPGTSYTFSVTANNAVGTSASSTSNSIKTDELVPATLSNLTFTDDGSGTGGKLAWSGKNIEAVLYTGPAASYPGPFTFGAFSTSWNGTIRNLTPATEYTISIYAISVDGIGESKTLTFKTGAKSNQFIDLAYWSTWLAKNTFTPNESTSLLGLLSKFILLETSPHRAYIKVPTSRVSKVEVRSLTPKSCSVISATAKVDAGLVKALTKDTCTISYTVSGPSKAPATLVKDFVFKKVS